MKDPPPPTTTPLPPGMRTCWMVGALGLYADKAYLLRHERIALIRNVYLCTFAYDKDRLICSLQKRS